MDDAFLWDSVQCITALPSQAFPPELAASVVAKASAILKVLAAADRCPGRGSILPAADAAFDAVLEVSTEGGTGSAETPAAVTTAAQPTPFSRRSTQGIDSAATTGPTVSAPASPGIPAPPTAKSPSVRISTRTRRRTSTAARNASPAVEYGFGRGGAPRPSARGANTPSRLPRQPLLLPPRLSSLHSFRPTATM